MQAPQAANDEDTKYRKNDLPKTQSAQGPQTSGFRFSLKRSRAGRHSEGEPECLGRRDST